MATFDPQQAVIHKVLETHDFSVSVDPDGIEVFSTIKKEETLSRTLDLTVKIEITEEILQEALDEHHDATLNDSTIEDAIYELRYVLSKRAAFAISERYDMGIDESNYEIFGSCYGYQIQNGEFAGLWIVMEVNEDDPINYRYQSGESPKSLIGREVLCHVTKFGFSGDDYLISNWRGKPLDLKKDDKFLIKIKNLSWFD